MIEYALILVAAEFIGLVSLAVWFHGRFAEPQPYIKDEDEDEDEHGADLPPEKPPGLPHHRRHGLLNPMAGIGSDK
jgi:hypothetical protein